MKVNRDQFMEDGYLVPPENLNTLRESYELMVPRQLYLPGFQSGPMHSYFEEMPATFGVENCIETCGLKP